MVGKRHLVCVAPMMDWTDRHDRYFLRLISRHVRLYTPMITSRAILHGDRNRLLDFHESEHPLALQIGGSDPVEMADCARIADDWGYDEININVGCPSDRVKLGQFGACLMGESPIVANCVAAMTKVTKIPISIKCRIGVDQQIPENILPEFISLNADAGCGTFIIHARKALLAGLSPAENRNIPPLNYPLVYLMKQMKPNLEIIINGGINSLAEAKQHLEKVDGVMVGRAAYRRPWILANLDSLFFDDGNVPNRWEVVEAMTSYSEKQMADGVPLKSITRHMMGLFHGLPGAKLWRRTLSENSLLSSSRSDLLRRAAAMVSDAKEMIA